MPRWQLRPATHDELCPGVVSSRSHTAPRRHAVVRAGPVGGCIWSEIASGPVGGCPLRFLCLPTPATTSTRSAGWRGAWSLTSKHLFPQRTEAEVHPQPWRRAWIFPQRTEAEVPPQPWRRARNSESTVVGNTDRCGEHGPLWSPRNSDGQPLWGTRTVVGNTDRCGEHVTASQPLWGTRTVVGNTDRCGAHVTASQPLWGTRTVVGNTDRCGAHVTALQPRSPQRLTSPRCQMQSDGAAGCNLTGPDAI